DEERRFWAALRTDYHPLLWFFLFKGLRKRACIGLVKSRVDLDNLAIIVRRKTKRGEQWVRQRNTPTQAAVLQREMALAPGGAVWSYVVQRGPEAGERRPITVAGFDRTMDTTLKTAGIHDFRPHDLRHDFGSKLLRLTGNLKLVQKALDHTDIKATVRYAHVLDEDVAHGLADLEQSRSYPGAAANQEVVEGRKVK
ncbi:MAG TPA: tyrosine-type recombinase/integrase, partial [Beijerinckiaceae bacterium]|nr:tyrosine-type recombinase/integrase [Beijerinckiaceae bacterium]